MSADRLTDEAQRQVFVVEVTSPAYMKPSDVGLILDAVRGRLSVSTDREVAVTLAARGVRAPGDTADALARVRAYLSALDAFYGDEPIDDLLDSADGCPTSPRLLLPDVRALAARPAPDTLADRVLAQAKADALRSQRDFFLSVDMPAAADHCEEAAVEWESARDDADRALLAGRSDASPEGGA